MSKYVEKAKKFRSGSIGHYNCAQAVISSFAADAGIDEDTVYKLAANFGGGMNRAAACGAISGGLMVLGLFGANDVATTSEFYSALRKNHQGCLECSDLLRIMKENGGEKKPHCDGMVYECVELAEKILRQKGYLS